MVRGARKSQDWSDEEERIYLMTLDQIKQKKQRREFNEYEYLSPMGDIFSGERVYYSGEDTSGLLGAMNQIQASKEEESGLIARLFGSYWELLSHNAETTLDQLTPVSPGAKLVHQRTAIEDYQRLQLYGTENAFWSHPVRDFFRPTAWLGAHALGYEGTPGHIQERRNLEEYFDTLKYIKNIRLANVARLDKDKDAAREFEARKDQTLFGVNPFTRNFTSIFRALPRRERDYFNSFAEAKTEDERQKILHMVPENERALYLARWKLAFADEVRRAKKAGLLEEDQLEEADRMVAGVFDEAKTEGFPTSKDLTAEYIKTRLPQEGYGDWYRRVKLLANLSSVPGPDWVGYHPSVDLEDIKLKVVQSLGEDIHEYDLWPSRAQALMNKPYINDEAIQAILEPEELSREEMRDRINELLLADRVRGATFMQTTWADEGTTVDIDHQRDPMRPDFERFF
jgi:hypothetical protein